MAAGWREPTLGPVRATRSLVCPILVGRDDLLDLADRRIAEVAAGRGQLLLLAGEAGVGKTRLLGAIERRASAAGFRTVRGGTYPSDLQVAGRDPDRPQPGDGPGRAAWRSSAGRSASDSRTAASTAATRTAGGGCSSSTWPSCWPTSATTARSSLALEDLHWSDDLTLEILEALARRLDDRPMLVIGTYRSDELFPRVPMRIVARRGCSPSARPRKSAWPA